MTFASVWGFALVGIDAVPVRVEAHARSGLPGVSIVGLPGAAVREAKERVRSGAASSGFPLPTRRITINLSPGDVPKDGSGFDLPVALATLAACGYIPSAALHGIAAVGEVSLDGLVRLTRGMLSVAEAAGKMGLELLIAPVDGLPAGVAVGTVPHRGGQIADGGRAGGERTGALPGGWSNEALAGCGCVVTSLRTRQRQRRSTWPMWPATATPRGHWK